MDSFKVVFLTYMVPPYRVAFCNRLSTAFPIQLHVLYLAKAVIPGIFDDYSRPSATFHQDKSGALACQSTQLRGVPLRAGKRTILWSFGLWTALLKLKPQVLIIGTNLLSSPVSWAALVYAKIKRIRVIRFEGMHQVYMRQYLGWPGLRQWCYRLFYKGVDAFFVYSRLSAEFLKGLGIAEEKVVIGFNVGDTEAVSSAVAGFRKSREFPEKRKAYPDILFLYVGQLIRRKNVRGLLDAFEKIKRSDAGLMIVGDGDLRQEIEEHLKTLANNRIWLEGYQPPEKCISYFGLADILVLPTLTDAASIVVSEALVSGLFVIASVFDGSAHNFIRPGINGLMIDPSKPEELEEALRRACFFKQQGKINREVIRATMADYTVNHYADRLGQLIMESKSHVRD